MSKYVWFAILGLIVYLVLEGKKAAKDVAQGVEVTSRKNWFYRAVNDVGDVLNDGKRDNNFSLGSWIYDATNPQVNLEQAEREARL